MIYYVSAVMAIVAYVGCAAIAFWLVRRLARPEAKSRARRAIWMVLGGACVAAGLWGPYTIEQQASNSHGLLAQHCKMAREDIYRTVDNVEGIYVWPPPADDRPALSHENDTRSEGFVDKPQRLYRFMEVQSPGANGPLKRLEEAGPGTPVEKSSARYGVTWQSLSTMDEVNAGIHGDETTVFDTGTHEILARRVRYAYINEDYSPGGRISMTTCKQFPLAADDRYLDRQTRDSYDFVSRVLRPLPLSQEERTAIFDLTTGSGLGTKRCVLALRIGGDLRRSDVLVRREDDSLIISANAGRDALKCFWFFTEISWRKGSDAAIKFADGTILTYAELTRLPVQPNVPRPYAQLDRLRIEKEAAASTERETLKLDPIREASPNPVNAPGSSSGGAHANNAASGPPPPRGPALRRWVDKNGEVHWSDRENAVPAPTSNVPN